jgi:NADPH:quinone reductase-like Zn-dependent oxidoreductase
MNSNKPGKRPIWKRTSMRILLVIVVLLIGGAYWLLKSEPLPPAKGSGEFMQAIVFHDYGTADVLRLERIEKMLPNENQVLIKVHAAAANPLDWHRMRGTPYLMRVGGSGVGKPVDTRLGADVAGEVVAVGSAVTQFKPGDQVFGTAGGAFAEFARASQRRIALKPATLSFEEAAALPVAAITALQALRDKGQLRAGQKVLINGASGGVGTFAVQIAKSFGAEVTGVCSTRNLELVRSLGADHVVDYTKEDFAASPQKYDVVLDNVGNRTLSDFRRVLTPNGIYVLVGGGGPDAGKWVGPFTRPLHGLVLAPFVSQRFTMVLADITQDDLSLLTKLIAEKKMRVVIDRTYPLDRTPDAIRYLEDGHARGKVIVSVIANSPAESS